MVKLLETPQYQCDYMLTSVSSYTDLVDTYCYPFEKQPHPSFMREDIFEPGQLPVSESIEVWYLPPPQRKPFLNQLLQLDILNPFRIWAMINSLS